jgi:hypothetical protein
MTTQIRVDVLNGCLEPIQTIMDFGEIRFRHDDLPAGNAEGIRT